MSERIYITEDGEKSWIELSETAMQQVRGRSWDKTQREGLIDLLENADIHRTEEEADESVIGAEDNTEEAEAEA